MASRDGNAFPKTWPLCYPNFTECIFNLDNCKKKKKITYVSETLQNIYKKSTTMTAPPWNG